MSKASEECAPNAACKKRRVSPPGFLLRLYRPCWCHASDWPAGAQRVCVCSPFCMRACACAFACVHVAHRSFFKVINGVSIRVGQGLDGFPVYSVDLFMSHLAEASFTAMRHIKAHPPPPHTHTPTHPPDPTSYPLLLSAAVLARCCHPALVVINFHIPGNGVIPPLACAQPTRSPLTRFFGLC